MQWWATRNGIRQTYNCSIVPGGFYGLRNSNFDNQVRSVCT